MSVRPAGDFYAPPGAFARHFTGNCPLLPPYDAPPQPGSSSSQRRCKCFLSHFGPRRAAALLRASAAAAPAGGARAGALPPFERTVWLPFSEEERNRSLRVVYTQLS